MPGSGIVAPAVRTLVISDLHLGSRLERDVLRRPEALAAPLVRRWLRATGGPEGIGAPVPADATPALARVVSWLGPATVRVHYPGVWLSDRIWATHGHYLDRHLLPEGGYGVARGLLGRVPRDGATPAEYERARSPSLARVERLAVRAPRPLAAAWDDLAEIMRASTMPG